MQTRLLASNQSSIGFSVSGDGLVNDPNTVKIGDSGALSGNLHVSIVGTSASVSIYGRAHPALPFIQLGAAVTATGVSVIPVLPEMYSQVTAIAAAVVNAAIAYPIAGR
jgi:hypothetical protein